MALLERLRAFPQFYQPLGTATWMRGVLPEPLCLEAAERIEALEHDLLTATSIGMATIIANFGPYANLSPYMRGRYDLLRALHEKCEDAFKRNQAQQTP